jgi:hypothetical protein
MHGTDLNDPRQQLLYQQHLQKTGGTPIMGKRRRSPAPGQVETSASPLEERLQAIPITAASIRCSVIPKSFISNAYKKQRGGPPAIHPGPSGLAGLGRRPPSGGASAPGSYYPDPVSRTIATHSPSQIILYNTPKPPSLAANRAGSYTGGPAKCRVWRSGSQVSCNGVARQPFSWPCKSVLNSLQRPNCEWLIAFAAVVTSKESSACRKPQYRKK